MGRDFALLLDGDRAYDYRRLGLDYYSVRERLLALLSGFFGVLALLLAALGVYGVTAYAVNRRRTELGIRLALGAAPAGIVRLVLRRVAVLMGPGVVAGCGLSVWAATLIAALPYGLQPHDPATLAVR